MASGGLLHGVVVIRFGFNVWAYSLPECFELCLVTGG